MEMHDVQRFLMELDRLKSIYRRVYVTDGTRHENSAEHSWHLAMALLSLRGLMPDELDIDHAVRIALVHDVCEIGAGDMSIYDPNRSGQAAAEVSYITEFSERHGSLADEITVLWREFEEQETLESRWVKTVDRLVPFLLNLASEGRAWKEQGISRSQVLGVNKGIPAVSPAIHQWMLAEIDKAVQLGWLIDS
jgi:putative hydrolase of HD superfamily